MTCSPARVDRADQASTARLPTYALLAFGMALFGSATPVSKLVGESSPALLASALRMAGAAAVRIPAL